MKKTIILSLIILVFFGGLVFADDNTSSNGSPDGSANDGPVVVAGAEELPDLNVMQVLNNLAKWLWTILLVLSVIFIMIGAYFFVVAAGDPDLIKRGRQTVAYALIGVAVAAMAWGLVSLMRGIFEGS